MTLSFSQLKLDQLISDVIGNSDTEHLHFLNSSFKKIIEFHHNKHEVRDLKIIQFALEEMIDSFTLFQDFRTLRKVSIFGSARTKPNHPNYQLTETIAQQCVDAGFLVITGAGPGIMEAGNKGAGEGNSFGLNILLPFEQEANPFIKGSEKLINFRYFFTRKLIFVKESDATVLLPGGFGTQDEAFEVLTLIQTGRCAPRPFILINHPESDYWKGWTTYVETQLKDRGYISPEDTTLYQHANTPEEVIAIIKQFYSTYHSIRYLKDSSVIRLNYELDTEKLIQINSEFKDIITEGKFVQCSANDIPGESDQHPEKPRLVFHFDRVHYGRILGLIALLNQP